MIFDLDWRASCKPMPEDPQKRAEVMKRICWAEQKLDGYRMTIIKDERGIRAHGKDYRNLWPKIEYLFAARMARVPLGTIFDGELYVPGKPATQVVTHYNMKSPELRYSIFAVPYHKMEDLSAVPLTTDIIRMIAMTYGFESSLTHELQYATAEQATKMGIEGFILKEMHYYGWWKIKPVQPVDLVVVGSTSGRGKNKGRIGSLICAAYNSSAELQVVANVGKGCDDQWRDMEPSKVIGKVVEVSHEGKQARGKLKFSCFLRWRDDKLPEQCTMEQLK